MKKKMFIFLCCFFFFAVAALATNLRGRVLRFDPVTKNYSPLVNARIDITIWNGTKWVETGYAFTGKDGFYYFVNFSPGSQFRVKAQGKFYPPQALFIQNILPPYYQEIPQIVL
jgi:hypothetical protein